QAEDGIRDRNVTGVQTCALPICRDIREDLLNGRLEDKMVEIEVEERQMSMMMPGMDNQMGDMLSNMMPKKKRKKRLPVKQAREHLIREESEHLIDTDLANDIAIERAETLGIIF